MGFEIDLRRGIFKTDGTPEDARALRETLAVIEELPPLPPEPAAPLPAGIAPDEATVLRAAIDEAMSEQAAIQSGPKLSDVVATWLDERGHKNKPRTVNAKRLHLEDFRRRGAPGDVDINALRKQVLVGFKAALLAEGQTGKTVDNKLLTLHDLFKYAIANGLYTASDVNPVAGLFVLTKRERLLKAQSYELLTPDDLRAIFEPVGFRDWASTPDLWFPPRLLPGSRKTFPLRGGARYRQQTSGVGRPRHVLVRISGGAALWASGLDGGVSGT